MATLSFFGANRQVTGSCYVLDTGPRRLMIDCGLYQERCCLDRNWNPFPFPAERITDVVLTHAHLDHCGLLPKLCAEGFRGRVFCTRPTEDLTEIVLEDSARIQNEDVATKLRRHRREQRQGPHVLRSLFTSDDVAGVLSRFDAVDYHDPIDLGDGLVVRLSDSGHILGSATVQVAFESPGGVRRTIVFSGDVGRYGGPLVHDPDAIPAADYVVMESTYGDRDHESGGTVDERLASMVRRAVESGGTLLVPTFAIDRAQDLLYHFGQLADGNHIPRVTVYLDSPMAIDVTTIYKRYLHLLDDETKSLLKRGRHPFQFRGLHFVRSPSESRRLNSMGGSKVILAGSGMCTGGRIKHHLRQHIEREETIILFSGFQAEETLGREILDGAPHVRIHGREYQVRARVERLFGLSAHADRGELTRWIGSLQNAPRSVFLTHGEVEAAAALASRLRAEKGWEVSVPRFGETVELA